MISEKYKINDSRNKSISLKSERLNESKKYLIKNNKRNLIGSYDLLAFEKFNKLFSFNFSKTLNDSNTNKSKTDC